MARQRKISTEELNQIITEYISQNKYVPKLKYTELVLYAKSLGYENIHPNDFGRNKEIKEKIELFNEKHKLTSRLENEDCNEFIYRELDVEQIISFGKSNQGMQRTLLNIYKENYNRAYKEIKKLYNKVKELEDTEEKIIKERDEILKIYKELKNQVKELKEQNEKQKKRIKSEEEITKETRFINYIQLLSDIGIAPKLKQEEVEMMMIRLFNLKTIDKLDTNIEKEFEDFDKVLNLNQKDTLRIPKIPEMPDIL